MVGFGIVDGVGTWAYDASTDDTVLTWPTDADAESQTLIARKTRDIATAGDGLMLDANAQTPSTWRHLSSV
ncbi:hypothetical protein [Streptomyces sp. NPDC101455]|uniref:hypothetical protein n=1 Tax=Streptomyces sp. NPDC101455 TaxID=3366142 RepID=UPI003800CB64